MINARRFNIFLNCYSPFKIGRFQIVISSFILYLKEIIKSTNPPIYLRLQFSTWNAMSWDPLRSEDAFFPIVGPSPLAKWFRNTRFLIITLGLQRYPWSITRQLIWINGLGILIWMVSAWFVFGGWYWYQLLYAIM